MSGRYGDRCNGSDNSNGSVYRALSENIAELDFSALQTLVVLWLGARGYRHMLSLGRHSARGRRRIGGADFIAQLPNSGHVRVAVQIRHWNTPVQRRVIDELWGFMLRHGIPLGLIITNGQFSPRAVKAAMEFPGRPIRLVSAAQLAGSMAALGMGVDPDQSQAADPKFFRSLDGLRFGAKPTDKEILERVDSGGTSSSEPQNPSPLFWAAIVLAISMLVSWLVATLRGRR